MIDKVGGPIIDLQLRQLEVQGERLLHNLRDEGRLSIVPFVGQHQRSIIAEDFFYFLTQLLVELLKSPFKINLTDDTSLEE